MLERNLGDSGTIEDYKEIDNIFHSDAATNAYQKFCKHELWYEMETSVALSSD